MSGLTEREILTKHTQSLREAADACQWLARNADPEKIAPRARHYKNLQEALKELEGTCRQMCAFRDDTRWLPLGIFYAKIMRVATAQYASMNWLGFGRLAEVFKVGGPKVEALANAKTGKAGAILPKRTDWLILPPPAEPKQLWTPQGRMMN